MVVIVQRVAVCGAGAMGSGIAQVAAQAGCEVIVFDVQAEALAASKARIGSAISGLIARGKMDALMGGKLLERLTWTTNLGDLSQSHLVIEAIVEDVAVKADLFSKIESVVGSGTILATNTSSLPISRLARGLRHPERFVGMHFFNPAPVMKLVEIVSGASTSDAIAEAAKAIAIAWGKVAIPVADVPGFIVNRVARPFYAEAFVAMNEGVPPALIDSLIRAAGFRMGPLELADLIGHDVNFAVASSVFASYFGRARFVPQIAQAALVDAGWYGRKTGRGVYRYDGDLPAVDYELPSALATHAPDKAAAEKLKVSKPGTWAECNGAIVGMTCGATAKAESRRLGKPVALLDWFDVAGTGHVGYAASDESASLGARSVITALGREALSLPDRPGLIVIRTLAQLANAAADAVLEQVADEAGIDAALRYGANYPFGPIEWAERLGYGSIVSILDAICEETGDAMYRASHYLRQKV